MEECREPLPEVDADVLIENREELIRQITPTDITNSLFQRRLLDLDDLNEIKQEERREGRRAGVEKLLARIHCSGPEGLEKFIESLKSSGYSHLASKLQESRGTIKNKTDLEKLNKSSENRPQEQSQTITRVKQGTTNKSSADRLQTITFIPQQESSVNISIKSDTRPTWFKEILRKHHLRIMENVRVEDIIDHLYSNYVIDWNDMDVIKTKLKSEGNREALRHLMDILHKSSHTNLPIFIDCLKQTGYYDIATILEDDMDSYQPKRMPSSGVPIELYKNKTILA